MARPGDPLVIRADDWNAAVAAGRAFENGLTGPFSRRQPHDRNWTLISLYNATEEARLAGDVVGLGDPRSDAEASQDARFRPPVLTAVGPRPEGQTHAILTRPVPDGQIARACVVAGVVWASVNLQSEGDTRAWVEEDRFKLQGGGQGYPIIWKPDGETGERWCVIHLQRPETALSAAYCELEANCSQLDQDVPVRNVRGIGWEIPEDLLPSEARNIWDLRGFAGRRAKLLHVSAGFAIDPDDDESAYWFIDMIQPRINEMVTGLRINGLDFEKESYLVAGWTDVASEGAWNHWASGEMCPPAGGVGVSSPRRPYDPDEYDLRRPPEDCGCGGE